MSAFPYRYEDDGSISRRNFASRVPVGKLFPDGYFSLATRPSYEWVPVSLEEAHAGMERLRVIGLVKDRNHHKKIDRSLPPERTYGDKGITAYGKRMVKSGCALLDRNLSGKKLTFATLTVPMLTEDDERRHIACWGDIVRKFCQSMKRYVEQTGREWRYVAATEIQPKRLREKGRVGLHLHIVFVGGDRKGWFVRPKKLRLFWKRAVSSVVRGDYCWDASENCKRARGSVGRYLGKYLSKGGRELALLRERFPLCSLPGQWWSMDSVTRQQIKESVVESESLFQNLSSIIQAIDSTGIFLLLSEIWVELPIDRYPVGYYGYLTRSGYDLALSLC